MFKKTLLAVTIAAMSTGAFAATTMKGVGTIKDITPVNDAFTVASGAQLLGAETMVGTGIYAVGELTVTIPDASKYASVSDITIKLSEGTFDPSSAAVVKVGAAGATALTTPTITYVDNQTLKVSAVDFKATADGDIYKITGLFVKDAYASGSVISATFSANASTLGVADTVTAPVFKVVDQFAATVVKGDLVDEVITVAKERKEFESDNKTSVATITVKGQEVAESADVNGKKIAVTLNGDFSFMVDAEGKLIKNNTIVCGNAAEFALAKDAQSVTCTDTLASATELNAAGADYSNTVTITVDGERVIPTQSFTADVAFDYAKKDTKTGEFAATGVKAGAWTLDGASVDVPYMPYGDTVSQIIYVTNRGSLEGDISVVALAQDGTSYDLGVIGTSKKGVTPIAGLIKTALEAEGFTGGKVQFKVTVNASNDNVSVYAAYNVNGTDRGFVPTKAD